MTVNLIRLGPLVRAVTQLTEQVQRLADAYERKLAEDGLYVRPPKADTSGADPQPVYTDEEMDALREELEARGQMTPGLRALFGEQDDNVSHESD